MLAPRTASEAEPFSNEAERFRSFAPRTASFTIWLSTLRSTVRTHATPHLSKSGRRTTANLRRATGAPSVSNERTPSSALQPRVPPFAIHDPPRAPWPLQRRSPAPLVPCSDARRKEPLLHPSFLWLPLAAFLLVVAVLGTEHLGRPLTDEEKKRLGALLREHDYPGARLIALRFAYKLTGSRVRTQDLVGRADLRLVRFGWDPARVTLIRGLCRLVWSEWTHVVEASGTAQGAEEGFLRELEATEGLEIPSHEAQVTALETSRESRATASVQLEKLRATFEEAGDAVNLLWLKLELEGVSDLRQMAASSGRDVGEFYAAAKRRKRAVLRLLANERGVTLSGEES